MSTVLRVNATLLEKIFYINRKSHYCRSVEGFSSE